MAILVRSVSDFDNLFFLRGKRKSSFLSSGIVSWLELFCGLNSRIFSFTGGVFLRNWSSVNCLYFVCFKGDLGGEGGGVSPSSSSSFADSSPAESRRRDIYSCECSSSWLVVFVSVLFDTRHLT